MSHFVNGNGRIVATVSLLEVYQGADILALPMTFHELVGAVDAGKMAPMICQDCGCIAASTKLGPACPECKSDNVVEVGKDNFDEAVEVHYPWRKCEHCGYAFLWDDDIAQLVEPNPDKVGPGWLGCPGCKRLTA